MYTAWLDSGYNACVSLRRLGSFSQIFYVKVTSVPEVDTLSVVNVHVDAVSRSPEKVMDLRE